jgi:hypothetical protein
MTNRDRAIFGGAWALMLAGIAVLLVLAIHPMGAAAATVPAHHHPVRTCRVSDWGSTAELGGHWFICQPARHGFTWQAMPGRQMAS